MSTSLVIDNYKYAEKDKAHQVFFNTLQNINNDLRMLKEVRDIAQSLIKNKKVSIIKNKSRWIGLSQVLVPIGFTLIGLG